MVIASSRKNNANERETVEQKVAELHTPTKPEERPRSQNSNGNSERRSDTRMSSYQSKSESSPQAAPVPSTAPAVPGDATDSKSVERATSHAPARDRQDNRRPTSAAVTPARKGVVDRGRSLDDLRSVLTKMTAETPSNAVATVVAETPVESKPAPTEKGNREQHRRQDEPRREHNKTVKLVPVAVPDVPKETDLRSTLAAVLAKVPAPATPPPTPLPSAVTTPVPPKTVSAVPLPNFTPASIRIAEETASSAASNETDIDIATVKKMLRDTGHERSPFL
jgi:hypothetical protein